MSLRVGGALLFMALGSGLWAQAAWRLSDALGNDRGPAPRAQAGPGWVLRVEARKDGVDQTLFHDGQEDRLRRLDLDAGGRTLRLTDFRAGTPVWQVDYDPTTGLPTTETAFQDGQASEVSLLTFTQNLLTGRRVEDGQGQLLYTDTLGHWPDGSLRRLERDGPEGPRAEVAWTYGPDGRLTGSWEAQGEERAGAQHRETRFTATETQEDLVAGTEVLASRVTEWLEAGARRETTTRGAQGPRVVQDLDKNGRPVREVTTVQGQVTQERRWTYDPQGRVLEASTQAAGPPELWSYLYRADGTTEAHLTRSGLPVRDEVSRDGEKVSVKLYDRGQLFLVEDWAGGKKVREVLYRQGQPVRERTF